jgi:hypothetical protein
VQASSTGIAEVRRLSGLTWEQLAHLFNVNRRSLHFWASGKTMTPSNEEHLQRVLVVLRKIDRGSASANRTALLASTPNGVGIDLLRDGHYDRAVAVLGERSAPKRATKPELSPNAKKMRQPPPPDELVGALHDRIHKDTGRLLTARRIQTRREK